MTAVTRELAEFAAGISYDALPAEVRERVKAFALDLVGIMLRARNDAESTPAMVSAAGHLGLAGGACTVIGDATGYTPPGAAMLNGTLAHSLDFDDTHAVRLAASQRAHRARRVCRRRDGRRGRPRPDRRHRGRLRNADPPVPGARSGGALRPRLSSDRDLRRVRRGGSGRAAAPARCGGPRQRLRHRAQHGGGLHAIPGERRVDQALARRARGDVRADRGHAGARRLQGRGRRARRQVGLPARLCARRRRGEGGGRARTPLGDAEDRGEALSVLPLRPRARSTASSRSRASTASRRRRSRRSRSACPSRAGS